MGLQISKGHIKGPRFSAEEAEGPDGKIRIAVDRGAGMIEFPDITQFQRIARESKIPAQAVAAAFGHMMPEKSARGSSGVYGSRRSIKLGHLVKDKIVGGVAKGSLILYDNLSGEVYADFFEGTKEGMIRSGSRQLSWGSAAKKSSQFGIPPQAFLQAFGHLLPPEERRELSRRLK